MVTRVPLIAALALAGCSPAPATLLLDLRTDYVPVQEFDRATVQVESEGAIVAERSVDVSATSDFLMGVRIAEIDGLSAGPMFATVELLSGATSRATRRIAIAHPGGILLSTAVISSDCAAVICPNDGDDPTLTECLGGRCVDESCTPESPELCPAPECESATECSAGPSCVTQSCVAGACLAFPDSNLCGGDESCDREAGCVPQGSCAADLSCGLFESECLTPLGQRCAALGLLDDGRFELVVYDAETGASCGATSVDSRPITLSGTPQLFGPGFVWGSGSCNQVTLSLDTGRATLEPTPCGLPSPLTDEELVYVFQEEATSAAGEVRSPDGASIPFTASAAWGRLFSTMLGEAALDVGGGDWDVLNLSTGDVGPTIQEPAGASVQGLVRDGAEFLWMIDGDNPEVVRASADGTELGRVAIQGLSDLGTFSSWVGVGCVF